MHARVTPPSIGSRVIREETPVCLFAVSVEAIRLGDVNILLRSLRFLRVGRVNYPPFTSGGTAPILLLSKQFDDPTLGQEF